MQAQSFRHRGQHQASYDHLYPVVVTLEADVDLAVDYKAETYAVFAILLWNMNQYERAAHYMSQAIDVYEQVGDHVRIETLRGDLSLIYVAMGRFKQAETMMQTAITQTEKRHLYYQLAQHIGTLAGFYMTQGRLVEAQPYLQKQIQLTEQTGNLHEQVRAVINRGCVRLLLGDYKVGLEDVEVGLPYYQAQNDQNMLILCQMSACYAYWGLGEDGKGKELAEEIFVAATTRFIGMPHFALFARRLLSLFCQPEEALVLLQESLALARTYQSKIQEAACLLSMAGLITDPELQNSYWTQGCTILAHLDATNWVKNHTAQNPPFIGMLY
jgi:tetratricopeptide (TPR) repeat protein